MGACRPDWHEIEPELMRAATVFVDSRDAALKESGDIILAKVHMLEGVGLRDLLG